MEVIPIRPNKGVKMDKILRWWEDTFGGNSAIWNLDYGKIIIICLLLYHMFWQ